MRRHCVCGRKIICKTCYRSWVIYTATVFAVKLDEWEKHCRHCDIATGASGSKDAAVIRVSTELPAVNVLCRNCRLQQKMRSLPSDQQRRSLPESRQRLRRHPLRQTLRYHHRIPRQQQQRERIERKVQQITAAGIQTQQSFLTLNSTLQQTIQLLAQRQSVTTVSVVPSRQNDSSTTVVSFRREQCLEFATGSIAAVLGMEYAEWISTLPVFVCRQSR